MGAARRLRKVGKRFGLTKRVRTELSDILYQTATVKSKEHKEARWSPPAPVGGGSILWEYPKFLVNFEGETLSLTVDDNGFYNRFEEGDKVKLGYRESYKVTTDYVPPNFEQKQELERVLDGYRFVSAEKIR